MQYETFVKDFIADRLNDFEGNTYDAPDLSFELTLEENNSGRVFNTTEEAECFICDNFAGARDTYNYFADQFGEHYNPFEKPDVFTFYMLYFGVDVLINQCDYIQEHWDEEVELTPEVIETITGQIEDMDISW